MPYTVAVVGGTGEEGRGLAVRLAIAGHPVVIGSRDAARASAAAYETAALVAAAGEGASITGATNADAVAAAELVIITVPFEAHHDTLTVLAPALAGKTVVDAVVPMRFERGPRPVDVEEGSAAEQAAAILAGLPVCGAFHNVAAASLLDLTHTLDDNVLVTGDDAEAKTRVRALVDEIAGLRSVDAGPLRFSRFVEGLTILLVGINGRYKAHAGVRIAGLPQ
jgi:NADPH-dependent F420 reductase